MGANAVTTVPVYTAGEVLTAADMNITNSGIPVFASTVERDAAFGGTGEKTLAEGQFAYLETGNVTQYYDGAAWQSVGVSPGLVRVGGGALSGSSTAFTSVFSATYDAYAFTISNLTTTLAGVVNLTFGATTANYYYSGIRAQFSGGAINNNTGSNVAAFYVGNANTDTTGVTGTFVNPFLTARTVVNYSTMKSPLDDAGILTGILNNTTSYTGFTLTAASGNLGGTVNIYGYTLS